MHAASLGNPNPNGHSRLTRLFSRVAPNGAIHTACMGTLWLSLSPTDNWCVVWDPPSVVQFCCLNHRCPMSHRPYSVAEDTRHILVIDIRPLIGTLAHAACETLAHAACGTQLTWPTITSNQRCPRKCGTFLKSHMKGQMMSRELETCSYPRVWAL